MKGIILSYRRGKHTQNVNQMLVEIEGINTKEKAEKIVGKEIIWKSSSGKEFKGKLTAVHGSKGVLKAKFEKNLPGQSIGNRIEVKA